MIDKKTLTMEIARVKPKFTNMNTKDIKKTPAF
jgi:hypothetical protein